MKLLGGFAPPALMAWFRQLSASAQRKAATLLIWAAVDLVVGFLNPFGIQDAINARAAETLQLVAAPFYGWGAETPGQRVVTVVMIDPAYFKAIRPDHPRPVWPMPVNLLATGVIRRILDGEPKALFIDIAFPDAPREIVSGGSNKRIEALEALAKRLLELKGRTPIFIGDDISPSDEQQQLNGPCGIDFVPRSAVGTSSIQAPALVEALFKGPYPVMKAGKAPPPGIELVDASWSGRPDFYPLAPTMIGTTNCPGLKESGQGYVVSPALALFKTYADNCPANRQDICGRPAFMRMRNAISVSQPFPAPDGLRLFNLKEPARASMSIRWGVRLSAATMRDFKNAPGTEYCQEQFYPNRLAALWNYLFHMISPVEQAMDQPTHRSCVYIDKLSAADLLDQRRFVGTSGLPADQESGPDYIKDFIKDRIVLLGAALPTTGDQFASPINGSISGIFVHAAALENLITSGDGYHVAESSRVAKVATALLGAFLVLCMTDLWYFLYDRFSKRHGGWGEHFLGPSLYLLILFILGTALIVALTAWTNLPLTEIAGMFVALHVILFADIVANWKKGLQKYLGG